MKLSNLKISLPNDFGIGSLTLFSFEKILITNEKKYGSLSNIYKYISKMKLFNLKISLSNDFGTGPLTLFSFEKKKKFICPALYIPDRIYVESFYTMKTIPNGDLEIAKLIMRYSGLSSRRYQYS